MRVDFLKMYKLTIRDANVTIVDVNSSKTFTVPFDDDENPVDAAVMFLNRRGIMISAMSVDSDMTVILLSK